MLGGIDARTTNLPETARLEVVEERLDAFDRPMASDRVGGRFLVRNFSFLDPSIYREGRDVTIVGSLVGTQVGRIGERSYCYPVVAAKEIHLRPKCGGQRDSPALPRRDWVWGYPQKGWSHTWGSIPPMKVPSQ